MKALAGRYLFRATGDWFIGAQGSATNYQVLGAGAEDDLVLEYSQGIGDNRGVYLKLGYAW